MPKKDVTPDEYLALMNAELQKAPGYVAGMRFVYSPLGSTAASASGTDFDPPGAYPAMGRDIQIKFDQLYNVVV
ncbi:hypothetical protein LJR175_003181 [Variovorax sp. LjRoot175]|uniref:hypothetical protein n=1 Tax=Variovorax sp. LjRoot175 TaxID=3342276 RepID=UPI003ECEB03A